MDIKVELMKSILFSILVFYLWVACIPNYSINRNRNEWFSYHCKGNKKRRGIPLVNWEDLSEIVQGTTWLGYKAHITFIKGLGSKGGMETHYWERYLTRNIDQEMHKLKNGSKYIKKSHKGGLETPL